MLPHTNPMMLKTGGLDVDKVFATTLYTDPGTNQNTYQPLSFSPDLVWHKHRTISENHRLLDNFRGTNSLSSSLTSAQVELGPANGNPSDNGFYRYFGSGLKNQPVVSWSFRRAKKFFDIVTYTGNGVAGRQIPHGLGVKPGMIVVKRLDAAGSWVVQHVSRGAGKFLFLERANTEVSDASTWTTEPTDAVFSVGNANSLNDNGGQYVAYLFAHDPSPSGIIQCGQYTGNRSATGPVVTLGWEPQFLILKAASQAGQWSLFDSKRFGSTTTDERMLQADTTDAELTLNAIDYLSTGFRLANASNNINNSGQTFIYLAIRKGKT